MSDGQHLSILFDVFQLELRVHPTRQDLVIRVTITGDTAPILTATVAKIVEKPHRREASEAGSDNPPRGAGPFGNFCVTPAAHQRSRL